MLLDRVLKVLRERVIAMEQQLAMGNCDDFAEYKEACGTIAGMKYAISEVQDLRDKHVED